MRHPTIIKFLVILASSSVLCAPSFGEPPPCPCPPNQIQAAQAENQELIPLQKTLERAYMQNAELDAARAQLRVTDETLSQANADWRPSLSVQGVQAHTQSYPIHGHGRIRRNRSHVTEYTARIDQNIYEGGRTVATIGQAESEVFAGRAGLFGREQQTLFDAISAHESVRANEDIVEYQRENVEFNKRFLERTQARFEVGEVSRTDVAASEASYDGAVADLSTALGQLEAAKAVYQQVTGCVPVNLAAAEILLELPETYEEALDIALCNNPSIIEAKYTLEAAIYNVDIQMSRLLPKLGVNATVGNDRRGGTGIIGNAKRTNLSAQAILDVPIYLQGKPNSQVRQAYQTVARQKILLVNAQRTVERDAKTAWENLIAAREAVKGFIAQVKAQELAVQGAEEEASVGVKTIVDVLFLEQDLITAQIKLVNAQQELIVATYAVFQAMGKLRAKDFRLCVKYYDENKYYEEFKDAWIQFWQDEDYRYVKDYVKHGGTCCPK